MKECCKKCHYYELERSYWKLENGVNILKAPCYLTKEIKLVSDSCSKFKGFPVVGRPS